MQQMAAVERKAPLLYGLLQELENQRARADHAKALLQGLPTHSRWVWVLLVGLEWTIQGLWVIVGWFRVAQCSSANSPNAQSTLKS